MTEMPASSSDSEVFDRKEPIPGYTTVELLGRGGFGEVWRAIAPGGLAKAVKIVFGDADGAQALSEMRSLTRIKDVRHPLLLSIERIEVVHGNLVIVTELADCSLKQQYVRFRDQECVGIPQQELLGYVKDVAEALDYLYEKHSLQHLDVKPENILLVGGRAKVGDFGLIKNLYERSASLVGGLTPKYAPPELFEGKPTRHSDQYSLAIVYMQMLTGFLPFAASNTAQLATQHLRGIPDLSTLPKRQSSVIARALSKDPGQRFENCVAMVEALKASIEPLRGVCPPTGNGTSGAAIGKEKGESAAGETRQATPFVKSADRDKTPAAVAKREGTRTPIDSNVGGRSEPLRKEESPIVLVGIGGAGVEVVARVVDRLRDRFGPPESWPAVEILVLDSNTRVLTERFSSDVLERVHVLPIPLQTAESYKNAAGGLLKWISRRWLYNIPRDLTTGGYRPLGRLALMTHASRVKEAIRSVISRSTARISSTAGEMKTDAPVNPRVLLIGSICGGTGGGALVDLAYALRSELKRCGHSDDNVHGVLMHATPRGVAERDKARASAYALLSELHHFSRPGSFFPGEPLLGTSPFHGDNAPFGRTHFLNLGSLLGETEWDLAQDNAAEFIYAASFTSAQQITDEPHVTDEQAGEANGGSLLVRSYDVLSFGAGNSRIIAHFVQRAKAEVLRLWREGHQAIPETRDTSSSVRTVMMNTYASRSNVSQEEVDAEAAKKVAEHELDMPHFLKEVNEVVTLERGVDVNHLVDTLVEDALTQTRGSLEGAARTDAAFAMIDQIARLEAEVSLDEDRSESLYERMVARLVVRMHSRAEELLEWIRTLVDNPDERINGARQQALGVKRHLQQLHALVVTQSTEFGEAAQGIRLGASDINTRKERRRFAAWSFRREDPDKELREVLVAYGRARLDEVLRHVIVKLVRIIDAKVTTVIEQLDRLFSELNSLAKSTHGKNETCLATDEDTHTGASVLRRYQQLLVTQLGLRRRDIAREIEQAIDRQLFGGTQGLRRFLDPELNLHQVLSRPLADVSRRTVLEFIKGIDRKQIERRLNDPEPQGPDNLLSLIVEGFQEQMSKPAADNARPFLIVPDTVDAGAIGLRAVTEIAKAIIVRGRKSDVTICRVHADAPLAELASEIIGGIDQYRELAGRLHSRTDITWSSFLQEPAVCFEAVPDLSGGSTATHTVTISNPARVPAET